MEYSVAKITIAKYNQVGTCYFLTKDTVATCHHVVEGVFNESGDPTKWSECEIAFNPTAAITEFRQVENLIIFDQDNDIAILKLKSAIPQAEPVSFNIPNNAAADTEWTSIGYPAVANGEIQRLKSDKGTMKAVLRGVDKISMIAEQAVGLQLGGFSGSPVFVNNRVIGHLTDNTVDYNGHNNFGTIYAVSSDFIYQLISQTIEGYGNRIDIIPLGRGEFYIKRNVESIISEILLTTGKGVMLSGYLKSGKTYTLQFFKTIREAFAEYEEDPGRIVIINLSLDTILPIVSKDEKNLDTISKTFCEEFKNKLIAEDIGFGDEKVPWDEDFPTAVNVKNWFNKVFRFFEREEKRLMLFIDDAGRLFNEIKPEENEEFFRILRGLQMEKRDYFGLLVSFTSTSVLPDSIPGHLLNAYDPVQFDDFTEDEIAMFGNQLCQNYSIVGRGEFLSDDQIKEIKEEIAGNPWMLILLFRELRKLKRKLRQNFDFSAEFENNLPKPQVYASYLQTLRKIIPADLKSEIHLFDGSTWKEPDLPSVRERRRNLVDMGILVEKRVDEQSLYKLRCRQFQNI
jgi:hypothetical protein